MNPTNIEWVKSPDGSKGMSWNPITGCLNGCSYCYARKLANTRLKERYLANGLVACDYEGGEDGSDAELKAALTDPFYPRFWEDRLLQPAHGLSGYLRTKPKGIFVCDMSDLFGIGIPEDWTKKVLFTIKANPKDRFYLLTKRPENLPKWSPFPSNVWLGVSVTNQEMFDKAVYYLRMVDAKVKFLSFEPLLDHISIDKF